MIRFISKMLGNSFKVITTIISIFALVSCGFGAEKAIQKHKRNSKRVSQKTIEQLLRQVKKVYFNFDLENETLTNLTYLLMHENIESYISNNDFDEKTLVDKINSDVGKLTFNCESDKLTTALLKDIPKDKLQSYNIANTAENNKILQNFFVLENALRKEYILDPDSFSAQGLQVAKQCTHFSKYMHVTVHTPYARPLTALEVSDGIDNFNDAINSITANPATDSLGSRSNMQSTNP